MNRAVIMLVSTALAASIFGIGCGGGDEDLPAASDRSASERTERAAPPAPTPTQTPTPTPAPTEAQLEGAREGAAVAARQLRETIELPSFYPEDGPIYPGAKPSKVEQAANGKVSVIFGTEAMPEEAAKVMNEAAEAKGWRIDAENVIERGQLASASKDGRSLMILTNRISEGTPDAITLVAVSIDP